MARPVGTAARMISRAFVRRRRERAASSASNIEALPGERDEGVLEARTDGRHAPHADTREHELAAAVFGEMAVEAAEDRRLLSGEIGEADAAQDVDGQVDLVGLDAQTGGARSLQL